MTEKLSQSEAEYMLTQKWGQPMETSSTSQQRTLKVKINRGAGDGAGELVTYQIPWRENQTVRSEEHTS